MPYALSLLLIYCAISQFKLEPPIANAFVATAKYCASRQGPQALDILEASKWAAIPFSVRIQMSRYIHIYVHAQPCLYGVPSFLLCPFQHKSL